MSAQTYTTPTIEAALPETETAEARSPDLQDMVGNAACGLFGLFGDDDEKATAPVAQSAADALRRAQDQLDLEAARIELADKFHVIGDDEAHDGGQNTLDEVQFEQMAQLYSDIRRGKTNLAVDTAGMSPEDAAKFKGGAMQDLGTMMQTESGRMLVEELAHNANGKNTTISQHTDPMKRSDPAKAAVCTRDDSGDRDQRIDRARADHDGRGNDAIVHYIPGKGFVGKGPDGYELEHRSDTILYHELTHALHRTHGTQTGGTLGYDQSQLPPVDGMDNNISREEYNTVGIGKDGADEYISENTYRDERASMGEDVAPRTRYSPDGRQQGGPNEHAEHVH